ncbi:flagella biosynthesis regulatory protein FliT [Duffyella gerundensis]|uniref:flagella biosynthesis regulatory protein FliT n=1 Tax=Duffyella TaxID=3026546 RepID=UPI003F6DFF39
MVIEPHLLMTYQKLLSLSQTMLRLASAGRWDELIETEVDYIGAVERLSQSTQASPISPQTLTQLRPVLRTILDNEAQVRVLLQERMNELASLVTQSGKQKSLNSTYTSMRGNVLYPQQDPL